jgi:hypothetical protein
MSERVAHDHTAYVPGCFRCDLSRDEVRVDRDALIAAAKEAAQSRGWITEWTTVAAMVDAVLPLIAGAIEARTSGVLSSTKYGEGVIDGYWRAGRLVRSLGGEQ